MSVVAVRRVAKGQFEIAADSIYVRGWTQGKDPNGKLWRMGDMVAGACGRTSVNSVFREFIDVHRPKVNTEWGWQILMTEFIRHAVMTDARLVLDENDFLMVYAGKAFEISGMAIRQVKDFAAIGAPAWTSRWQHCTWATRRSERARLPVSCVLFVNVQ